jgi:hypothetical protein
MKNFVLDLFCPQHMCIVFNAKSLDFNFIREASRGVFTVQ